MMTDIDDPSDESALLAAELALGLLDGDAEREALRRHAAEPRFAAEVARWREATDRWLDQLAPEEPSPGLLASIERKLDVSHAVPGGRPSTRWKTWALTSMAASVALAVGLGLSLAAPRPAGEAPSFAANVTQISDAAGTPLLSAVYNRGSGRLSLRVASLEQGGKVPELWVIPEGGTPHSLGVILGHSLTIELSDDLRALLIDGATIAVTLEPQDGAPHEAPTGEILGAGTLQAIEDAATS